MTTKPRIAIVIGSTRPGRYADKAAGWILKQAQARDAATPGHAVWRVLNHRIMKESAMTDQISIEHTTFGLMGLFGAFAEESSGHLLGLPASLPPEV